MDQQFRDCPPVLLIGRHLDIELHCADYALVLTCYHDSTCAGARLGQNFVDPKRARLIDGEGREEAYPSARMYDGVQELGQHVYVGIDGSSSRIVRTPLLNPDFRRGIHWMCHRCMIVRQVFFLVSITIGLGAFHGVVGSNPGFTPEE